MWIISSKLCRNHHACILEKGKDKDTQGIFKGFSNQGDHNDKLIFYCKNHNQLSCLYMQNSN